MACELIQCCRFFTDNMKDLPKTAEYIRSKLCLDDFEACTRFRIYKEYGKESLLGALYPDDVEEVDKAVQCLREKKKRGTPAVKAAAPLSAPGTDDRRVDDEGSD